MQDEEQRAARVAEILNADVDAAFDPFFDHDWEPPLCYAVRQKCGVEVIKLLIEHGADIHATDVEGATPIKLLRALPYDETKGRIEEVLVAAGANEVTLTTGGETECQKDLVDTRSHMEFIAGFDWEPPTPLQNTFACFEDDDALILPSGLLARYAIKDSSARSLAYSKDDKIQCRKFAHVGA